MFHYNQNKSLAFGHNYMKILFFKFNELQHF